jgi:hypothetical protein
VQGKSWREAWDSETSHCSTKLYWQNKVGDCSNDQTHYSIDSLKQNNSHIVLLWKPISQVTPPLHGAALLNLNSSFERVGGGELEMTQQ